MTNKRDDFEVKDGEIVHGKIVEDGSDGGEIVVDNPVNVKRQWSAQERQKRAIALKLAGASYKSIAETLGYADSSGAQKAVSRGLKASLQENAGELRKIHYGRLEHLLMLVWPQVNNGDTNAIHTGLAIMDRMERLYGLNAAEKLDVSAGPRETVIVADGDKEEYIESMRKAIEEEEADKNVKDAEVVDE
jgi:hypothetical protein